MPSFAVNRKDMNRGTGEKSGVWVFEEFMFADSVFGRAVVEYDATAVRVKNEDRETRSLMSAPYEMRISGAKVTFFEIFNDNGDVVASVTFTDSIILICPSLMRLRADVQLFVDQILSAFAAVESDVISFEMGLL